MSPSMRKSILVLSVAPMFLWLTTVSFAASIRVEYPNGGESWTTGQRYTIRWTSADVSGNVRITLRNWSRAVRSISGRVGVPNTGNVTWTVPADIPPGDSYYVVVKSVDDTSVRDISDKNFSIMPSSALAPRGAELSIEGVSRLGSDDGPLRANETIQVTLAVLNRGTAPADVYAATLGNGSRSFVKGERAKIPPYDTVKLSVPLKITHERIHAGVFTTSVFLLDAQAKGSALLDLLWKDGNKTDNERRVNYPAVVPSYDVSITLTRMDVHDSCDNASDGDWIVMVKTRTGNGEKEQSSSWPIGKSCATVRSGSGMTINRELRLQDVKSFEDVIFEVGALDCDGDTWIPSVQLDYFGIGHRKCCAEQFPEVSGGHDSAGRAELRLSPQQWIAGGEFLLGTRHFTRFAECDTPTPFSAHVSVIARER